MNEAEKSGSSIGSRIGAGFAKVGKAVAVGIGAASTAVGTLATMSVKGYSDYEQLAGGVETLFKKSSQSVINNASKAYQTAGMSANEYMETVTGFSASLLQSLGGDTQKAAEKADTAIRDMSDNANKMGTDIESIQNAYQGFAKQNYTMLDNLKLGYGGTKSEMERLLSDAEKISGIKYDVSSYSDIVDAIHVVQTEMHISGLSAEEAAEKVRKGEMTEKEAFEAMGTTAKEASTTIQGSLNSAKSAWQNLVTGLADDNANLEELVNNFFNSIVTVGENIIPRISVILNGITGLIQKLAPKIIQAIPGILQQVLPSAVQGVQSLLQAFVKVLPQIIQAIPGIMQQALPSVVQGVQSLLQAFVKVLPQSAQLIIKLLPNIISAFESLFESLVDALPSLLETLLSALPTLIPQVVSAIINVVVYLCEHIGDILQPIIEALPDIIVSIVTALMDNLPSLIDGVISLVLGIVRAIPQIILGLLEAIPTIIENIITGLIGCLPQLIEGLIMLNIELVEHLPEIIMGLIKAIPKVIIAIGEAIVKAGPNLFSAFGEVFGRCWEKLQEAFSSTSEFLENLFSEIGEWFSNVTQGIGEFFSHIWQSITGVFSKVGEFFSNVFSKAVSGIKNAFDGIKQWFSNLWQGIWNVIKTPINWIIDGINSLIDGLNSLSIKIPDWVPVFGGQTWGVNIPKIAKLAKGGFVEGGTPFIAGEAGAEAVIPLENNNQWIYKFAHAFADGLNTFYGGDNFTQTPTKGAGGKVVNINLYLDNVNVKNDDDIEDVANKVSERIAEKLVAEGMAVG